MIYNTTPLSRFLIPRTSHSLLYGFLRLPISSFSFFSSSKYFLSFSILHQSSLSSSLFHSSTIPPLSFHPFQEWISTIFWEQIFLPLSVSSTPNCISYSPTHITVLPYTFLVALCWSFSYLLQLPVILLLLPLLYHIPFQTLLLTLLCSSNSPCSPMCLLPPYILSIILSTYLFLIFSSYSWFSLPPIPLLSWLPLVVAPPSFVLLLVTCTFILY